MARGRLISKSLGSSRKFHEVLRVGGKLGEFAQMLFMLIVANTDDYGRMPGDAFTVKNVVLPSSPRSEAEVDRALDALQTVNLIDRYQVAGVIYLEVQKFDVHQPNLHKRTLSLFPESPGISGRFRGDSGNSGLTQNPELGTQNPEPGTRNRTPNPEGNPEPALRAPRASDGFEQFWEAYPKKKAKEAARKAWEHHRPDDALLRTILAAIAAQRQSPDWVKDRGRYIPHPATWLNRGQWSDEPTDTAGSLVSEQTQQNLANREEAKRLIEANTYGPQR